VCTYTYRAMTLVPVMVLLLCARAGAGAGLVHMSPVCQAGTSGEHCCAFLIAISNMAGAPIGPRAQLALGVYSMLGGGTGIASSGGRPVYAKASSTNAGR
jgi:hypothetical protein